MRTYNQNNEYTEQEIHKARLGLLKTMEALTSSKLYPYQGEWLSPNNHKTRREADSQKAQIHFKEIIGLNIAIALLSCFLLLLVVLLCY